MERILIVEDNKDMQFLLSTILQDEGFETIVAGDGKLGVKEYKTIMPDLVLLDMRLPGMNGMEVFNNILKLNRDQLVIMITAFADVTDAVHAMKKGAYDYITKPFNNDDLILTIKKALKTRSLCLEVESLKKQINKESVARKELGQSFEMKKVIRQVDLVAPTNMSVLIQGESGTGKEVVANLIHSQSERDKKPFVAVDCGAIPDTLVESELFGHERGAFTGADSKRIGKFEEANGGTLLLDEITNLPVEGQAKLLRALEERKITHLGGKKPIAIDVRIIATSNLQFKEEIAKGKFRSDLFHRLNEFEIQLPLLKERSDDIPMLAKAFVNESNTDLNKSIKGISIEAMKILLNYEWLGNVRELKHVIKRAVLLEESDEITPDVLSIKNEVNEKSNDYLNFDSNASFESIIDNVERDLIIKAIKQSDGNKSRAAEKLNINRKTLYRKIKYLNIPLS